MIRDSEQDSLDLCQPLPPAKTFLTPRNPLGIPLEATSTPFRTLHVYIRLLFMASVLAMLICPPKEQRSCCLQLPNREQDSSHLTGQES